MRTYTKLHLSSEPDLIFGSAVYPLTTKKGLVIGGGTVYPELNFTLPPIEICNENLNIIKDMYHSIMVDACERALNLECPGFVVEFETLIEMTLTPQYAIEVTKVITGVLEDYFSKYGLKTALRITPNDTHEKNRPPKMFTGKLLDGMLTTFEECTNAGAELLSIESTGVKKSMMMRY